MCYSLSSSVKVCILSRSRQCHCEVKKRKIYRKGKSFQEDLDGQDNIVIVFLHKITWTKTKRTISFWLTPSGGSIKKSVTNSNSQTVMQPLTLLSLECRRKPPTFSGTQLQSPSTAPWLKWWNLLWLDAWFMKWSPRQKVSPKILPLELAFHLELFEVLERVRILPPLLFNNIQLVDVLTLTMT